MIGNFKYILSTRGLCPGYMRMDHHPDIVNRHLPLSSEETSHKQNLQCSTGPRRNIPLGVADFRRDIRLSLPFESWRLERGPSTFHLEIGECTSSGQAKNARLSPTTSKPKETA